MTDTPKELSFDGCGINGPDQYRTRLATFNTANWSADNIKHYGKLLEAAPDLLRLLAESIGPRKRYREWRREVHALLASIPENK